jgi:hypothetical protein
MPSLILQENGSRILLEDNTGALLQESAATVGPGTVTIVDLAVTGTLTIKDGAL